MFSVIMMLKPKTIAIAVGKQRMESTDKNEGCGAVDEESIDYRQVPRA